jgi:hypothetical protein
MQKEGRNFWNKKYLAIDSAFRLFKVYPERKRKKSMSFPSIFRRFLHPKKRVEEKVFHRLSLATRIHFEW